MYLAFFKCYSDAMKPVLIIEDDIYILESLQAIFEMEDYPVLKAGNGLEALNLLKGLTTKESLPGVIYVDSMMPIMNGQKFITELQTNEEYAFYKKIPIVVLSAGMNKMVGEIAGRVDKPATIEELLSFAEIYCK